MTTTLSKKSDSSFSKYATAVLTVGGLLLPLVMPSTAAAEKTRHRYESNIRQTPSCDPRFSDCNSAGMEGWDMRSKGTTTYEDGFTTEQRTLTHMQDGEEQWTIQITREGFFGPGVHHYRRGHDHQYWDNAGRQFSSDRRYLELPYGSLVTCDDPYYVPAQTADGRYVCVPDAQPRGQNHYAPSPPSDVEYHYEPSRQQFHHTERSTKEFQYQPRRQQTPGENW